MRKHLKYGIFVAVMMLFCGCTQIRNTYTITGDCNVIRANDSVVTDKNIDDMIRVNGSGYGDVQGGDEK